VEEVPEIHVIPNPDVIAFTKKPAKTTGTTSDFSGNQIETPAEQPVDKAEDKPEKELTDQKEIPADSQQNYFLPEPATDYYPSYPSKKHSGGWRFSTGVSTNLQRDFLGTGDLFTDPGEKDPSPDPDEKDEDGISSLTRAGDSRIRQAIQEEGYTYDSHALPFSAGVMVRGNVTDRLSVETGIIYTYLSSRLTKSGAEAQVKQHYIGIPLNLIWQAWQQDNWQIYISAGATVEKGVRLALHEHGTKDGVTFDRKTTSGISGVQASSQISPGIEYALNQDWSIYLEPRLSYYFKNGQPTSNRTEHPLTFGIGGGLRYTF